MSIPEGATHKAVGPRIDCWYKNINCLGFEFMNQGGSEWIKRDGMPNWPYERIANEQPKQWSGPEDGFPPVGTVCEFDGGTECPEDPFDKDLKEGMKVTIIAHFKCGDFTLAAFTFDPENPDRGMVQVEQASYGCFRPIKTPAQLAAEKRETAIRELMDIAQVDCRVTAARLVDAGFKREVV